MCRFMCWHQENSMNNPMVEETKLADRENIGDNTVEKEMQCVKILPETKGIDKCS